MAVDAGSFYRSYIIRHSGFKLISGPKLILDGNPLL